MSKLNGHFTGFEEPPHVDQDEVLLQRPSYKCPMQTLTISRNEDEKSDDLNGKKPAVHSLNFKIHAII